ncbi:MAG: CopD family protein [Alphaproteobacteria bacterium]|nr:CopD family protein [Alphaproteobacteria bacterium]
MAILKAVHLFAAFAWMAGLWYHPRLLVYQRELCDLEGSDSSKLDLLQKMAARLMRFILMPAMTGAVVFGLWLAVQGDFFEQGWIHAKLLCVAILVGFSVYLARLGRQMRAGEYALSAKQLRLLNEVPSVILIAILFFAVVYSAL